MGFKKWENLYFGFPGLFFNKKAFSSRKCG